MNPVEIEEAICKLAEQEFDPETFPFAFLEAFGNPETTIQRLKNGQTNSSDVKGGVLQRNNIHIATCESGSVAEMLTKLRESPATTKAKAKFIAATDGIDFEAESLTSNDPPVICAYKDFPRFFGFFLPLAGISTVKQIQESSLDIKATGRLNRLYVELLKNNPEWGSAERSNDMNHFMARLIFCFFAEDTDIFDGDGLLTKTIERMSARDSSDTHEVIGEIFRSMNTKLEDRKKANLPRWANDFPYVNGGLFSKTCDVPRFSKIARSFLISIGNLEWTKINPDIFGSMIQAVTEDEERGSLGLHYTSVSNILKVLNPLFLDDLRTKLEEAGNSSQKLLNLRKRMAKIRVFDPACGSGNFLVISYKEMRAIEAEINQRRGEIDRRSDIPLTNFRGIELRNFPAEIARLALVIAEYQCDVLYRGQKEALKEFLPLDEMNWIINGNALRLDWLSICPPTGIGVQLKATDLISAPLDPVEIDFENEGGETYICGNPPYLGSKLQTPEQKEDLKTIFSKDAINWKLLDYVSGWLYKAAEYGINTDSASAFVSTNSICQGVQVPILWPLIFDKGYKIFFAHTSFNWSNLAKNNAGVTVVIVGISNNYSGRCLLYTESKDGATTSKNTKEINAYLLAAPKVLVVPRNSTINGLSKITNGSGPHDGGHLLLNNEEKEKLVKETPEANIFIRLFMGSQEIINGKQRWCIWIENDQLENANKIQSISERIENVRRFRKNGGTLAKAAVDRPHQFAWSNSQDVQQIAIPGVASEKREYITAVFLPSCTVVSNAAFIVVNPGLHEFALISSRMHWMWISSVCGRLAERIRYSGTIGWNIFPVPKLTEKNILDLEKCSKDILLARESCFPSTIAEMYDPERMPVDLRRAHDANDEVVERVYIGRRFKNDTERLEKLFELYTIMTTESDSTGKMAI